MAWYFSIHSVTHPSVHLSPARSQGQQFEQGCPDLLEDPKVFLNQSSDIVNPVFPGSPLGSFCSGPSSSQITELLTLNLPPPPPFSCLYLGSCSFSRNPKFMTTGESRNIVWLQHYRGHCPFGCLEVLAQVQALKQLCRMSSVSGSCSLSSVPSNTSLPWCFWLL